MINRLVDSGTSCSLLKGRRQGDSEGTKGEGPVDSAVYYQPSLSLLLEVRNLSVDSMPPCRL
jgi:hypothetical protein